MGRYSKDIMENQIGKTMKNEMDPGCIGTKVAQNWGLHCWGGGSLDPLRI